MENRPRLSGSQYDEKIKVAVPLTVQKAVIASEAKFYEPIHVQMALLHIEIREADETNRGIPETAVTYL